MLQRKNLVLAVSLGLPLSLVSAHGELRAHAQDHPVFRAPCPRAEVRPDAPAPISAPARSRTAPPVATAAPTPAEPPVSAERQDAPSARAAEVTTAAPPASMSAHDAPSSTAAELATPAPPNAERPAAAVAEDRDAPSSTAAELATAAPPSATVAAPPSSARQDAPASGGSRPVGEARPLVELASDATRAEPAPAPSDALRELDDVLSGEPGDPLATMEPRQSPAASAESPSPEETAAAIERVLPSVRACVGDDASGVVVLRLEFVSSGRASAVLVQSQSAHITHAQRACIARAARRAQVSAFQRSHFALSYPIRL